jgi:hypothetical protein
MISIHRLILAEGMMAETLVKIKYSDNVEHLICYFPYLEKRIVIVSN